MPFKTCTHTKTDGKPCGSPAVRNETLCYYHGAALERAKVIGRSVNCRYVFTYTDPDGNTVEKPTPHQATTPSTSASLTTPTASRSASPPSSTPSPPTASTSPAPTASSTA